MMNKKMIRIICIILAALMALSCLAVLTQVFAAEAAMSPIPVTGDNDARYIVPIVIVAIAVLIVAVCLIVPKLKKKDGDK